MPVALTTTTSEHSTRLQSILENQLHAVELLLDIARQKRDALLARDRAALERLIPLERAHLQRVREYEEERFACVGEERLSALIDRLPPEEAEGLSRTSTRLLSLLQRLDDINQQNAGMIVHSIAHVRTLIRAVTGESHDAGTYSPTQGMADGAAHAPVRSLVEWRV